MDKSINLTVSSFINNILAAWGYVSVLKFMCLYFSCTVRHGLWVCGRLQRSKPWKAQGQQQQRQQSVWEVGRHQPPWHPLPGVPRSQWRAAARRTHTSSRSRRWRPGIFYGTLYWTNTKLFAKECTLFYQEVIWSFWPSNLSVNSSPWPYKLILTQLAAHCHNAWHIIIVTTDQIGQRISIPLVGLDGF